MENDCRLSTFDQYNMPKHTELMVGIRLPTIDMTRFELNPVTIQMLSNNSFWGRPNEDPNAHLTLFKMMCRSIKREARVTDDDLRLLAFPWTLMDVALEWLYDLAPDSIHTWDQLEDQRESLYDAWRRYKGYQKSCPHHGLDKNYLVNTFFRGLRNDTKTLIRASCGGSIQNKLFVEFEQHIELMAQGEDAPNEYSRDLPRNDDDSSLQLVLDQLAALNVKFASANLISTKDALTLSQEGLGMYSVKERTEDLNYMANNNCTNSYNPDWKNHPNLSYNNPASPGNRDLAQDTHALLQQFIQAQEKTTQEFRVQFENIDAHFKLVDNQIAQLASVVQRPSGSFPVVDIPDDELEPTYVPPPPRPPPVPFPSRLKKHNEDSQFVKFVEMLKKLEYLKDILTKKRVVEKETVALTVECNTLIQHELPLKRSDPGSFSIPCKLGNVSIDRALCDLGTDVSLFPLSIFKKLDVGE
ncbi:PREDICTED: uncharacterized protein LOC104824665 [Tarenaya hassleriana]|uniref:uncharacterized protein LOC104824665 n=1 Tax=Tarenaya hassleriana TaxID=28532 RepID=UPI00053C7843|nr:PREDICTED: uncharacterized protein LOC104824665 [Tarenaya hassleriana]